MPLLDLYLILFVSKIVSTIVYADGIRVYADGEGAEDLCHWWRNRGVNT